MLLHYDAYLFHVARCKTHRGVVSVATVASVTLTMPGSSAQSTHRMELAT